MDLLLQSGAQPAPSPAVPQLQGVHCDPTSTCTPQIARLCQVKRTQRIYIHISGPAFKKTKPDPLLYVNEFCFLQADRVSAQHHPLGLLQRKAPAPSLPHQVPLFSRDPLTRHRSKVYSVIVTHVGILGPILSELHLYN